MNILHFHMFNMCTGWGGSASMTHALYNALVEQGHNVDLASPKLPDPYGMTKWELSLKYDVTFGPEKRSGEITIDEISSSELEDIAFLAAEKIGEEVFETNPPDLLIANHINLMALICWHLHNKYNVPYRIIAYGSDTKLLLRDQRYRDLFGEAAKNADGIYSISAFTGKEVEETVGGNHQVLGGAVDPECFYRSNQAASRGQKLIYLGRLVTEKGIWTLLDAMAKQQSASELIFMGEGPLRKDIEEYIEQGNYRFRVAFTGHVSQSKMRDTMLEASAVVVPSLWEEPLGLVVWEALACGIPVIASAVGGIPEMIRNNQNGILVPKGDSDKLASAIDQLLGDPVFYKEIQKGAEETCVPTYSDVAKKLVQFPKALP